MSKKDIRLFIDDVKFSSRAVGVIIHDNKVLLQKRVEDLFWALPGGAIEILERSKDVILRELEEEIGLTDVKIIRPIWFVEYFFNMDNTKWHQYMIGYLLEIGNNNEIINMDEIKGIEVGKNIIYKWVELDKLKDIPVKPDFLKKKILKIEKNFEMIEEND